MIQRLVAGSLVLLLVFAALWGNRQHQAAVGASLAGTLSQIVAVTNEPVVNCADIAAQRPLVLLALGQSNAGNLGERSAVDAPPVTLIAEGKCIMATDPLPGSTGTGGSIWRRLPQHLRALGLQRPVVLSVMGIDATSIADWTDVASPLRRRLVNHIQSMHALGLPPQAILWQQGEADARLGTTAQAYGDSMGKLALALSIKGVEAPIFVAFSTVCRSAPNAAIRHAIVEKVSKIGRFRRGPDTDALAAPHDRWDGCHFSKNGLDSATQLWAAQLYFDFASI